MDTTPTQAQHASRTFGDELRQLLRLALPIAFVQFGMTAMNFVDVALLGRHDAASLPAMALGNTLAWAVTMFCMGMVTAADPLLSQAVGANDRAAVPRLLGRAGLLCVVMTIPAALLLLPAATWLELLQQPTALIPEAAAYARLQALGLLPFLLYAVLRSLLSSHARLWPQVVTIVVGNLANFGLDYVLIFGKAGLPALGATGASITTVACRWLMLFGLLWFGRRDIAPHLRALRDRELRKRAFAWQPLRRLMKLGAPIGVQFMLEMGAFATTAFLIGYYDARTAGTGANLGGHQVALQLASLSFMVPVGVGMAASVRVGWSVGRGDALATRRSAIVALCTGAGVMTAFMGLFRLLPHELAQMMTDHDQAIAVAASLIPIAGVFQIADGLQVVSIGCLRGLGDMRSPVIANLIGFWLLGLPLGCYLTFGLDYGPAGLWWGLVIGLSTVALGLLYIVRLRTGEHRTRLSVD